MRLVTPLGRKMDGQKTFVQALEKHVPEFYAQVGQYLRPWVPRAPAVDGRKDGERKDDGGAEAPVNGLRRNWRGRFSAGRARASSWWRWGRPRWKRRPGWRGCEQRSGTVLIETRIHDGELVPPVESLESYFRFGGTTVLQAAFAHSYFLHPDKVRQKTPLYPDRARLSRKHYPKRDRGDQATWRGREVRLGDNSAAQRAWASYSGRPVERGSGYSVRHVWGHPWDPDAFTAGWNLCYMPFWAGMLTERQHARPELEAAVRQAAWDLYFRHAPVCTPPDFVTNPGIDLDEILCGQPLFVLAGGAARADRRAPAFGGLR